MKTFKRINETNEIIQKLILVYEFSHQFSPGTIIRDLRVVPQQTSGPGKNVGMLLVMNFSYHGSTITMFGNTEYISIKLMH